MKVERKCKIVSKEQMGDAVYMVLEAGDMVRTSFRAPGQFVHVKCGEGLLLRRPISVCTCYSDEPSDLLTIVFEVRGEGTDWLARRPVGHSLDVLGLAGNGFTMKPEGRYLLVGGGIGIPPMLGCAQYTQGKSTAILGGRSADKIILQNCFQDECAKVLTATDDGSLGHHGFVDALVRQEMCIRDRGCVLCGAAIRTSRGPWWTACRADRRQKSAGRTRSGSFQSSTAPHSSSSVATNWEQK